MVSLLLFAALLGLTCATYPPYTTGGSYLPYTTGGIQGLGYQTFPYSTGGIGNFPSTYNTFSNGYYPSSSYLFNSASYPTVVSHYLYFPAGNPWEPGRNYIDLRANSYPWYLRYHGGLGTGFGNTNGFPIGFGGSLNNGLTGFQTGGFPTGFGNYGFPGTGVGGYYPRRNIGGQIYRKKIY